MHSVWGSVQSICSSIDLTFLFFALVFIILALIAKAKQHPKGFSAFLAPLSLFLPWVLLAVPTLIESEHGTLREAVDRQISPEATIKKAAIILTSSETGVSTYTELSSQQIEQLEAILETCAYSNCARRGIPTLAKCTNLGADFLHFSQKEFA